jgi:ABC-type transporter Mla subunit MlaD
MGNPFIRRSAAALLILTAGLGLLFSAAGILVIWQVNQPLTDNLLSGLDLTLETLRATRSGLETAQASLESAAGSLESLQNTLQATGLALDTSLPAIQTAADLVGEELPNTLAATQTSLASAQATARLIDDVLRLVSAVPFFGGPGYNPDVPLSESLGRISRSLSALPQALTGMQTNLEILGDNLATIQANLAAVSGQTAQIEASLQATQQTFDHYLETTHKLIERLVSLRRGLPGWIDLLAWGGSLFLAWLGVAQIGLLLQGAEMLRREPAGK